MFLVEKTSWKRKHSASSSRFEWHSLSSYLWCSVVKKTCFPTRITFLSALPKTLVPRLWISRISRSTDSTQRTLPVASSPRPEIDVLLSSSRSSFESWRQRRPLVSCKLVSALLCTSGMLEDDVQVERQINPVSSTINAKSGNMISNRRFFPIQEVCHDPLVTDHIPSESDSWVSSLHPEAIALCKEFSSKYNYISFPVEVLVSSDNWV